MTEYLAGAAGATLGFIAGDVPGAYWGYKAGRYFAQRKNSARMPVAKRGRSTSRGRSRVRKSTTSTKRRKLSTKRRSSSRRSVSKRPSGVSGAANHPIPVIAGGVSTRAASMRRVGKTRVGYKRKRVVKVSKGLRAKIQKVVDGGHYHGKYIATYYGAIYSSDRSLNNGNPLKEGAYSEFINLGEAGMGNITYWSRPVVNASQYQEGLDFNFFSPARVLDAASILWNSKTATQAYRVVTKNFTSRHAETGVPFNRGAAGVKIFVKNSWVEFELVNASSQRCKEITLNICTPKVKWAEAGPVQTFRDAYVNMQGDSTFVGDGPCSFQMYPKRFKQFNIMWKVETVKFCIEAGQTIKYRLQGPKNTMYDFDKFNDPHFNTQHFVPPNYESTYQLPFKGLSRVCFFTYQNDLLVTNAGKVGTPYPNYGETGPVGIRYTTGYSLTCPENAGFLRHDTPKESLDTQQLNQKHDMLVVKNFVQPFDPVSEAYVRIDEENPAVKIENPS